MGKRTGNPRGRPPGSKNKRDVALVEAVEVVDRTIDLELAEKFPNRAHALLKALVHDNTIPIELRLDAAKAALAYEKPKLAAVQVKVDDRQGLLPLWDWIAQHADDAGALAESLADESESSNQIRH